MKLTAVERKEAYWHINREIEANSGHKEYITSLENLKHTVASDYLHENDLSLLYDVMSWEACEHCPHIMSCKENDCLYFKIEKRVIGN